MTVINTADKIAEIQAKSLQSLNKYNFYAAKKGELYRDYVDADKERKINTGYKVMAAALELSLIASLPEIISSATSSGNSMAVVCGVAMCGVIGTFGLYCAKQEGKYMGKALSIEEQIAFINNAEKIKE